MIAVLTLLFAIVTSLLVVRVATVALVLTGLSSDLARFEARSAFTGSGFTTKDSEKVVNHPVRRQIIMMLMVLGNAGIVTVISSLVLSFTTEDDGTWHDSIQFRLIALIGGILVLWYFAHSKWVDRQLSTIIRWALKRFSRLDVNDYVGLLHLGSDYSVVEMYVDEGNWMADKSLMELRLSDEGVLVLGIEKLAGSYAGAPKGKTRLGVGDTLLVYGPHQLIEELDKRRADFSGYQAHRRAVQKQRQQRETPDEEQSSVPTSNA
ncbi:MAG: TrkA C-terminal domain-containing protein [Planctomycetota bacterium]